MHATGSECLGNAVSVPVAHNLNVRDFERLVTV
jgi:hypothetical protein